METRVYQRPPAYQKKKKKKKRFLKWSIGIILFFILAYFTLFLLVVPERPDQPFFEGDDEPLIIAHRGGAEVSPENTLVAVERAVDLGVDVVELDIHLSQDGHLMIIHDESVDRTTNGEGLVNEMTKDELQQLDAAYHFRDVRGYYVYRGNGITIPTVEQLFEQFPDVRFNLELKEPEEEEMLEQYDMAYELWELIEHYGMHDQVLVSSFSEPIMETFRQHSQGSVATGASESEATRFVFYHKLFLDRLYRPDADAIQLPPDYAIFSLTDQRIIEGAQRLNMPIHYWTINDEDKMRELLEKGVDGIITDDPELLIRVMNEMEANDEES